MKELTVYAICLVGLLAIGVWLARRWLLSPTAAHLRYPRWIRIVALIASLWVGTFVAHAYARRINSWLNDGIAYDEGAELPYDVVYDGVGDNVMCLLFGWLAGFICWGIARALKSENRNLKPLMRIIFMGTGEIGLPSLRWLLDESGHEMVGVYTQPDRPVGRSGKPRPPQVKVLAEQHGVPVYQPERLRGDDLVLEALRALRPDLIVVVAYGQMLPRAVLEAPAIACINLHASLLPRHRGASPIQAAIREGDTESGMTVMHVTAKLDAGDAILAESTPIREDDTGGRLHDRLAELGPPALARALPLLEAGKAPRQVQDETLVTHCGKLTREHGRIDWSRPAVEIERTIRAYDPWPGTHTTLPGGKMLKLFPPVALSVSPGDLAAGQVRLDEAEGVFLVGTGEGALRFGEGAFYDGPGSDEREGAIEFDPGTVQVEGRKRVSVADFLTGRGISGGEVLGEAQQ